MYTCKKGHQCCCVRCMASAAKVAIAEKNVVRCQERDRCDAQLDEADLRELLARVDDPAEFPMSLADEYAQQILMRCVLSIPGIIACPTPGCKNWIIPFDISLLSFFFIPFLLFWIFLTFFFCVCVLKHSQSRKM